MNKKKYFKIKTEQVQRMIWDLEFKRHKTLQLREKVRQEYDNLKARLQIIQARLDSMKGKESTDEYKGIQDEQTRANLSLKSYEEQMTAMDTDVNGSPKTNQYPEGYEGINDQLGALRELVVMLKDYQKSL